MKRTPATDLRVTSVAELGTVWLLGVPVDRLTLPQAVERLDTLVRSGSPSLVVTPNVDHLVRLQRDAELREVYACADLVLADGMPLVWASRLLGRPLPERVAGSDLLPAFAPLAAQRGHRLFLLGGEPGSAARAARVLGRRHPGLNVCGVLCPPKGFERVPAADRIVVEAVRRARPDVLFVGLGSPKQERWLHRHMGRLQVPVALGVGAAMDMVSGRVARAPLWMQRWGLEWTWRLWQEPGRLWVRYLLRDPAFVYYLGRQLLSLPSDRRRAAP